MNDRFMGWFLTLILALCTSVLFTFFLAYKNFQILAFSYGELTTLNIYLKTDILDSEKNQLLELIKKEKNILEVKLIDRKSLLNDYSKTFGFENLSDFESEEYLDLIPEVIEVKAGPQLSFDERNSVFKQIASLTEQQVGVDTALYATEWLQRFDKLIKSITIYGIIGFLLVLLMMSYLVTLLMRVMVYQEREELEIESLLGATVHHLSRKYTQKLIYIVTCSLAVGFSLSFLVLMFFKKFILQSALQSTLASRLQWFSINEFLILLVISFLFLFFQAYKSIYEFIIRSNSLGYDS